jgi:hypothetical protein
MCAVGTRYQATALEEALNLFFYWRRSEGCNRCSHEPNTCCLEHCFASKRNHLLTCVKHLPVRALDKEVRNKTMLQGMVSEFGGTERVFVMQQH